MDTHFEKLEYEMNFSKVNIFELGVLNYLIVNE